MSDYEPPSGPMMFGEARAGYYISGAEAERLARALASGDSRAIADLSLALESCYDGPNGPPKNCFVMRPWSLAFVRMTYEKKP